MYKKQSIDRGLRLIGGYILIFLAFAQEGLDPINKIVAFTVGLYAFITGIINFCPLAYFITQEKSYRRKIARAQVAVQVKDVKGLTFFEGFTEQEVEQVLTYCYLKEYPREVVVLYEGKPRNILSIIFSGQFKVVKAVSENESKIITTISDGETYGEMSFFDHLPPCGSIISMEDSKVLEIDENDFAELMNKDPQIALKILNRLVRIMSSRIRALNDQIASLGNWVVQNRPQLRSNPLIQ